MKTFQDNYCREAFTIAYDRSVRDRKMRLIVIMVGNPSVNSMPENIQTFIRTGSYLKWNGKRFWQKLIYRMPHVIRKERPEFEEGWAIPLSVYSETSEFNATGSDISAQESLSYGYVSQSQSDLSPYSSTEDDEYNVTNEGDEASEQEALNKEDDESNESSEEDDNDAAAVAQQFLKDDDDPV